MPRRASARRSLRIVLLAPVVASLALLVLTTGCGGPDGGSPPSASTLAAAASPHPGGVYDFPLRQDVTSLGPYTYDDSIAVTRQIYEGLVEYRRQADGSYSTVPSLAESWSANADATVWTFRLRRGVRFQAPWSREVTARDVVADFRYGADPAHKVPVAYMYAIIAGTDKDGYAAPAALGVRALDRYTVRFTLKRSLAAFPDLLGHPAAWVWPVGYLRRVGLTGLHRQPVGTGPFALSRWVRGDHIDLVRNPAWWNAASGRPYLDGVHFQVFPSVSAGLLAFQRGQVDCTWVPQGQIAASKSLPQVASGEWSPRRLPSLGTTYVAFNMDDPIVGGAAGLPVRQAFACVIDREALVAAVQDGVNIPQTGLVPPILAGWAEAAPREEYDPARAAQLYRAAGSPRLLLVYPDFRWWRELATWIQSACEGAGMRIRQKAVTWPVYEDLIVSGRAPAVFLTGWVADYPSADNFLYDLFHSGNSRTSTGTRYADPDVDRLLTLASSTSDVGRHFDLDRRAAQQIQTDLPMIPLYEFADYRLVSARIGGFEADPMGWVDMSRLWVR
jgi:ABC-type transport system substrate-binding protein